MSQKVTAKSNKIAALPHEDALGKIRPRVRFRRALFSFFVVMVISSVVYIATPLSRLGIVYFEGLNILNRSDLISLINIDANELFLSIRTLEIQRSIEPHPLVNQVNVARSGINRLRIEVVEYEVGACVLVEGELFHVLDDGTILPEDARIRANCDEMMIHDLSQDAFDAGVVSLFVRQLMRVEPQIRDLIQMIEHAPLYGDLYRFSLLLIDGNVVNITSHTMPEYLNLYREISANFEVGQTGILHLDVGIFFEPHQ